MTTAQRQSVKLRDGRTLSYIDAGDPAGVPALFIIGSPSSAAGGLAFAGAAERNGVRMLSIDKPGYGQSTRQPRRSLLSFGEDVRELCDSLGWERVAVIGQSGGGPHAMAAAHVLGDRASTLCLLSSGGPSSEAWASEAKDNPLIRTTTLLANRAPWLMPLPMLGIRATMGNPERARKLFKKQEPKLTPRERQDMQGPEAEGIFVGIAEAFSSGTGAAADEFYAICAPWGFRVEDIKAPTDLWHGTIDKSCPIGLARALAAHLPDATLHELPGIGHGFFGPELDEAMETVRHRSS